MKANIYVNWNDEIVCSEKEYEERLEERAADYKEEMDALNEFLCDVKDMGKAEIFNLTSEQKEFVNTEFVAWCKRRAEEDMEEEWDRIELDL